MEHIDSKINFIDCTPLWLRKHLEDSTISDICINRSDLIFVDKNGAEGLEEVSDCFKHEDELKTWVLAALSAAGKFWDARYPFVDSTLPQFGHRLHAVFPPISTSGIMVSLRSPPLKVGVFWQNDPLFEKLRQIIQIGESIVISGATGTGKTTLLNELINCIPHSERMIALEDTAELNPSHPQFVRMLTRPQNTDGFGEVDLRTLMRQALRMRPDRILLGECRGSEVLELLQALNTGHRGAMATLHANSPRDALRRIELLCSLASQGSVSENAIRELLASGVRWVVQVERKGKLRRITDFCRVEGREGDALILRPFYTNRFT